MIINSSRAQTILNLKNVILLMHAERKLKTQGQNWFSRGWTNLRYEFKMRQVVMQTLDFLKIAPDEFTKGLKNGTY